MLKILGFFSHKTDENTPLIKGKEITVRSSYKVENESLLQQEQIIACVRPALSSQHPKCKISQVQLIKMSASDYEMGEYKTKIVLADLPSMQSFLKSLEVYNSMIAANLTAPEYDKDALVVSWFSSGKNVIRFLNFLEENKRLIASDKNRLIHEVKGYKSDTNLTLTFAAK